MVHFLFFEFAFKYMDFSDTMKFFANKTFKQLLSLYLMLSVYCARHRKNAAIGESYVKPRSQHCWNTFLQFTNADDLHFKQHLCISWACFEFVYNLVRLSLSQIPHQTVQAVPSCPLPMEKKVAMCLHKLGIGGALHHTTTLYGVKVSTIYCIFWQFVKALVDQNSTFIKWPKVGIELGAVKSASEEKQGFSKFFNAIDATHINMKLIFGKVHSH